MSKTAKKLGNRRVTGKEQFYTPRDTAEWVVSKVLKYVENPKKATWLEPSAGSGVFIDVLAEHGITDIIATDIEPHHKKIKKQDFLAWKAPHDKLIAIGNPPFGRNNALSIPFFNHCAQSSDVIAFIVPRSWRKWSVTNRLSMDFELKADFDLHINYVDAHGNDVYAKNNLKTCLQIWKRTTRPRKPMVIPPTDLAVKCNPAEADIAMRVFGYGCGTVYTEFDRKPNTTMIFLKVKNRNVIKALKEIDFAKYFNNVSYTQALAFAEIRYELNKYFKN